MAGQKLFSATRFVRFVFRQSMRLCRVNLAGSREGFGPSVERAQLPLWSLLLQAFYVYFTLKLALTQVLQHKLNVLTIRINSLDSTSSLVPQLNHTRRELQAESDTTIGLLRLIGFVFHELGFAAEPPVIVLIVFFNLGYTHPHLFIKLYGPVRLGALRMLLDPGRERTRLARDEVGQLTSDFIASSSTYWLITRREQIQTQVHDDDDDERQKLVRCQEQLRRAERAHRRAVGVVHELAASGRLMPPNRRREWHARLAQTSRALIVFFFSLGACIFTTILLTFRLELHIEQAQDFLFMVELLLYEAIGVVCIGFYLVALITCALDQVEFVTQLRGEIEVLSEQIARPESVQSQQQQQGQALAPTTCNRHLVRTLILYRQLLGQLRAIQPFVGFIGAQTAVLALFVCALNRAYAPYLDRQIRYLYLTFSIFIIICCDILIVPYCLLHARCLRLFKSMSCLQAHLDACELSSKKVSSAAPWPAGLDEHTVWLLRKHLNSPEAAARRLTTSAYFMQLTYSSFLGIHFWCGLLMAPLLLEDTAHLSNAGGSLLTAHLKLF